MPMVQGAAPAVAGDGRTPPSSPIGALSEEPKPVMDHTRSLNQTRTNIKAPARISKQSKGCGEGALY